MNTILSTSSLRSLFNSHPRKLLVVGALLCMLALGVTLAASAAPSAAANPSPTWYVDDPILYRAQAEPYDHYAVKDPTIVYSGGRYHMFYTGANASGGWQMLYSSATTLEGFRNAAHSYMSSIGESYFCAPEVFYFEPDGLWYLIYQDGTYGAAYATTTNIADPNSWSGPRSLGISGNMGWDYYVICDDTYCYMYNSPDDNSHRIYMRRTTVANFPAGWGSPSVAISDTFEGVNVYKSLADGQFYLLVEDLKDNRYYELWTSSSAGGPWTQVAEKWAWHGNLVYNGSRWTTSVSHGEIIRAGVNQKLEINDINRVDFLIQGTTDLSGTYQQIPWDLGVIRNYTGGPSPTSTPAGPTSTPSANLLTNGNIESGTSGWSVFGSGSLAANTSVVHSGSRSLLITGRTAAWNGPRQAVTSLLTNGRTYTTSVWVRSQSGTPSAKVTLQLTADGSTSYVTLAPATAINPSNWTLLSGTAAVSWSGTLSSANFYVETTSGTDSFYIDDASFGDGTNTPIPPTSTLVPPTNTPVGPTNTPIQPTNTPIGPTLVPTNMPTQGGGTCSPVDATISAPFTFDGTGTFCWQTSDLGSYINSWNLASLTVNGVNYTNTFAFTNNLPPKIGGFWYVSYTGNFPWSHFEAR
ncbi:MAG: carbohydrate binding domain-containing protein [Anaerolineae bacterium]|nr:carbohydrate binding domain-containing protein [Anaerolineae bacterium]